MKRAITPAFVLLVVIAAAAAIVATAGLYAVFESWTFIACSAAGALVAVAATLVAARYRLLPGESIALSVVLFVVVGIVVVGGAPTPGAARTFFSGLVNAWADMVSATQPADLTETLRVVPFALCWFGVLLACELIRWTRPPSLPIVGPLATLSLTALLSAEDRTVAIAQGALLATAALALGAIQQRRARREHEVARPTSTRTGRRRREVVGLARVVVMLAVVGVAAPLVGPRLPLAKAHERYDLRDENTPPWDPLAVPSPLVELKGSLAAEQRDKVVFTVTSSSQIDRWQTAVLGDYDGVVWTVGSGDGDASTEFRPVDTRLPRPPSEDTGGAKVRATVTVTDLRGPWLPSPGWATAVDIHDKGAGDAPLRANLRTGTLAVASGVTPSMSYDITAYEQADLTDEELADATVHSTDPGHSLDGLPPPVKNLAADLFEGKDPGWQDVISVRDDFRGSGFYDSSPSAPPGHSFFRLAEFLSDPQRIVGYEEQYAAAAAVLLRTASVPVRVVVGYRIPADRWVNGSAEVHAGDISAWIEVHVDGHGWVAADITPDRTRTPTTNQQGTVFEDVAVPNPPPPPQLPPNVEVITDDSERDKLDEPDPDHATVEADVAGEGVGPGIVAAGAGVGSALLVVLLGGSVMVVKWLRRRRRRAAPVPATRVAGAWLELSDRCREAGVPLPQQTTPLEAARAYLDTEPSAPAVRDDLLALVATVDRAAYHPQPPGDDRAEQAWRYSDRVVDALVSDRSLGRRLVMRIDPRPLRHRDPVAAQDRR